MFELGDYVKLVQRSPYRVHLHDEIGRIVAIRETDFIVVFPDSENYPLHDCQIQSSCKRLDEYYVSDRSDYWVRLKEYRGLYLDESEIELVEIKKGNRKLFRR